jgi:NAD(P)-dependent dehydrogenase (short-subunit alcohol dehydrogenase family)
MTITTVLVTGANRGLGLEFVKLLVKHTPAPRVIVATCRDPTKAQVMLFSSTHSQPVPSD